MRSLARACLALILLAVGGAEAQAGTYKFKLHNNSTEYVINGFHTYENGVWSKNWIHFTLRPGDWATMDWGTDAGNCVVPFKVDWVGYDSETFKVDWCKVSNIYMKDEGFSWD